MKPTTYNFRNYHHLQINTSCFSLSCNIAFPKFKYFRHSARASFRAPGTTKDRCFGNASMWHNATFGLVLLAVRLHFRTTGIADQQLLMAMKSHNICTTDDKLWGWSHKKNTILARRSANIEARNVNSILVG